MNLIAAVDRNWAIGKAGRELVNIPEDKKFFREETTGNIVVMGRKTLESMPNCAPLPNRENVVLSSRNLKAEVTLCHTLAELGEYLRTQKKDIYIIGGGSIYKQFLPLCDTAHITKVDYKYDADTYFPNLDKLSEWEIKETSEEKTYFDMIYEFVRYSRKK